MQVFVEICIGMFALYWYEAMRSVDIKDAGLIARGHVEVMLDVGVVGHPHVALPFVIAVVGASSAAAVTVKAPSHASLLALLSISTT